MPDWTTTRLEVQVNGVRVTPVTSFIPTFKTPRTVLHSIEQDNVGFIHQPRTATFVMKVAANSESVVTLTQMALDGTRFNIAVVEKDGTEWSFKSLAFRECIITSAVPSDVGTDTATPLPIATFEGTILGFGAPTDIEV